MDGEEKGRKRERDQHERGRNRREAKGRARRRKVGRGRRSVKAKRQPERNRKAVPGAPHHTGPRSHASPRGGDGMKNIRHVIEEHQPEQGRKAAALGLARRDGHRRPRQGTTGGPVF